MATSRYTGNSPEEIGKRLPLDTSARRPHCGSDRSCSIRRTSKGVQWHCFRCGEKGYLPVLPTLAEIRARNRARMDAKENPCKGVQDLVSSLPGHAVAFLAGRGCPPDVPWVGWSPGLERLCFRLQWTEHEGWLTRDTSVPRPKPKYIMYSRLKAATPVFCDGQMALLSGCTSGIPVLCEDILSAYKVSTAGYIGMALIGTHATSIHLSRIIELLNQTCATRVHVWLDPDRGGREGSAKIMQTLKLMGITARNIQHGNKDPKYYSTGTIKEILCDM